MSVDSGRKLTDLEAFARVEAECRPGGHPLQVYHEVGFMHRDVKLGAAATTAIIRSLEERIVAIELKLGLTG